MRKKIGMAMTIAGLLLYFQPNFDVEQIVYYFQFLCDRYWPLALAAGGFYLMNFQLYHPSLHRRKKSLRS